MTKWDVKAGKSRSFRYDDAIARQLGRIEVLLDEQTTGRFGAYRFRMGDTGAPLDSSEPVKLTRVIREALKLGLAAMEADLHYRGDLANTLREVSDWLEFGAVIPRGPKWRARLKELPGPDTQMTDPDVWEWGDPDPETYGGYGR